LHEGCTFFDLSFDKIAPAIRLFNEDGFLTIRDKAMLEVFYSAALRVSELVGKKYRMERSSGPRLWQKQQGETLPARTACD